MQTIELIANRRGALSWIYKELTANLNRGNKRATIISIVLQLLFSSGGFVSILTRDDSLFKGKLWPILIILLILNMLVTSIPIMQIWYDYTSKIRDAQEASSKNAEFLEWIRQQLADSIDVAKVLDRARIKDAELRASDPDIPQPIIDKYYDKFGASAIRYDVLFGHVLEGPYLEPVAKGSARVSPMEIHELERYRLMVDHHI